MKNPKNTFGSLRTRTAEHCCRIALITSGLGMASNLVFAAPLLIEAENMDRDGFATRNSGISSGQRLSRLTSSEGTLSYVYNGESQTANIAVTFYDESDGSSPYTLRINGRRVARWVADRQLGSAGTALSNRSTVNVPNLTLNPGDTIELNVGADGGEFGRVDTIAIETNIEAESMERNGYTRRRNRASSGGFYVESDSTGTLTTTFTGQEGYYAIKTHYYDESDGSSRFELRVDGSETDKWVADGQLGSADAVPEVLTVEVSDWVYLKPNSKIELVGRGNRGEAARVDRIEIAPAQNYIATIQASRFLSQATMGGTRKEIYSLARRISEIGHIAACEEWIDGQFEIRRGRGGSLKDDALFHQTFSGIGEVSSVNINNFEYAWWDQAVTAPDQLRYRMAFALSQIFVTSSAYWNNIERKNIWFSYTSYYDKLLANAFGTHRDLLQAITYDPFMGVYLTFAHNSKGDPDADIFPDENYAREVMQLFSCGVFSLRNNGEYNFDGDGNIIENYTNDDIREFAEVFTGLSLVREDGSLPRFFAPPVGTAGSYVNEMVMVDDEHDTSDKHLLNGLVLEGLNGDEDISQALDNLAYHRSTGPHLARQLIKRLTSSNPSSGYITRVNRAWRGTGTYGNGIQGDFKSVLKAILLDKEARNTLQISGSYVAGNQSIDNVSVTADDQLAGRVQEPILRYTRLYRYFEPESDLPNSLLLFPAKTNKSGSNSTPDFGQIPMRAKSVFNFYDTEYSPGNGPIGDVKSRLGIEFVSPETEILAEHVVVDFEECLQYFTDGYTQTDIPVVQRRGNSENTEARVNFTHFQELVASGITLEQFMRDVNRDLCNGQMSQEVLQAIIGGAEGARGTLQEKLARALAMTFSSADYGTIH